jgi:hypothetical protein
VEPFAGVPTLTDTYWRLLTGNLTYK